MSKRKPRARRRSSNLLRPRLDKLLADDAFPGKDDATIEADLEALSQGIDPEQTARHLRRAFEGVDLEFQCSELVRRHARRYEPLSDPAQRRKLAAVLIRRGFDPDMAGRAVERVCARSAVDGAPE